MAFDKESETLDFAVPGELRFIRISSIFGKMSTAVCRARVCGPLGNEKPEPREASPKGTGLWLLVPCNGFDFSSGEWTGYPQWVFEPLKTKATFSGGF